MCWGVDDASLEQVVVPGSLDHRTVHRDIKQNLGADVAPGRAFITTAVIGYGVDLKPVEISQLVRESLARL
ncbi:hypothetical protein D8S78_14870 [Natrialba swarupiae]|nr:hypothetical protein [Natrialba swarupiae]